MTTSRLTTSDAGFTLVELMLVLVLAIVIAAMAAPSLTGSLDTIRLDAAADQVRDAWADARLRAIRTGEPIAFQCQIGTSQYCVSTLTGAGAALAGADTTAENADLSTERLGAVTFAQLSLGAPDETSAAAPVNTAAPACLIFRPDGATDDAYAVVQAEDGRRRTITLRGLTGAANVSDDAPAVTAP